MEEDKWRLLHWPITSLLCYLQGPTQHFCFSRGSTQVEICCDPLPRRVTLPLAGTPVTDCMSPVTDCISSASWDLKTGTPCISCEHLHISFHNTNTFLLNHVTASAYFHWCILCREFLIDSLVKGQYTTKAARGISLYVNSDKTDFMGFNQDGTISSCKGQGTEICRPVYMPR